MTLLINLSKAFAFPNPKAPMIRNLINDQEFEAFWIMFSMLSSVTSSKIIICITLVNITKDLNIQTKFFDNF